MNVGIVAGKGAVLHARRGRARHNHGGAEAELADLTREGAPLECRHPEVKRLRCDQPHAVEAAACTRRTREQRSTRCGAHGGPPAPCRARSVPRAAPRLAPPPRGARPRQRQTRSDGVHMSAAATACPNHVGTVVVPAAAVAARTQSVLRLSSHGVADFGRAQRRETMRSAPEAARALRRCRHCAAPTISYASTGKHLLKNALVP